MDSASSPLTEIAQIEAESLQDIAESFEIEAVPSFVLLRVSYLPVTKTPSINSLILGSHPPDKNCRS